MRVSISSGLMGRSPGWVGQGAHQHATRSARWPLALLCALCLGGLGPALDHAAALQDRIDAQSHAAHAAAQERAKTRQHRAAVALCLADRGAGAVATWANADTGTHTNPTTITCTTRPVRGR